MPDLTNTCADASTAGRATAPQLSMGAVAGLVSLCLGIAYAAQRSLDAQKSTTPGVLMYAAAAIVFGVLMRRVAAEPAGRDPEAASESPSALALALGLGVALLGCLDFGDNTFRPLGVVLWIGGLAWTLAHLHRLAPGPALVARAGPLWRRRGAGTPSRLSGAGTPSRLSGMWIPATWLVLGAILLVGAWFRLARITEIPADLGPDLIHHYYDTLDILQGEYRVHFPERESLIFYVTAVAARLIGLSRVTLHVTSALIGVATIAVFYLLGKEAFNKQVGLLAALLLAINRWHITLSRSAYPAVFTPLFTALTLYALLRALRRGRFVDFAWAGAVLGLGFYTYTPFKFLPVVVLAGVALYALILRRRGLADLLSRTLVMFLLAVVVAAPVVRFAIERPREYFVRELVTLRLQGEQGPGPGLAAYYWRNVLGLVYRGDSTSRWNVPGARHMGLFSGAFMVLGLGYVALRWRRGHNSLLLATWFIMIMPAALGMLPNDSANSLRSSGVLAPAIVLAALPLFLIQQALRPAAADGALAEPLAGGRQEQPDWGVWLTVDSVTKHFEWAWRPRRMNLWPVAAFLLGVLLLVTEAREAQRFYFVDYVSRAPDRANYSNAREIAREIRAYGDLQTVWIKTWEFWFDSRALRVNLGLGDEPWEPWLNSIDAQVSLMSSIQGTALFIVNPRDTAALDALHAAFPRGVAIPRYYPDGNISFYAFHVQR